jgi:hypothetical protein
LVDSAGRRVVVEVGVVVGRSRRKTRRKRVGVFVGGVEAVPAVVIGKVGVSRRGREIGIVEWAWRKSRRCFDGRVVRLSFSLDEDRLKLVDDLVQASDLDLVLLDRSHWHAGTEGEKG